MDIYLSGRFTVDKKIEKKWLKRTGCKHRCFSFAVLSKELNIMYNKRVKAALQASEEAKTHIMLDSGAFTLHQFQVKSSKRSDKAKKAAAIDIHALQERMFKLYCDYCLKNKDKWAFYVTLDYVQSQPVIYAMQQKFAEVGLAPMPTYHGDSPLDWLGKHKDMGHSYIAIGGKHLHPGKHGLQYYLDNVFNYGAKHGIEYHGLALTSLDILISWPFKSVDSSTWSRTASFGCLLIPDLKRRRIFNIHVSDKYSVNPQTYWTMTKRDQEALTALLRDNSFDMKEMHDAVTGGDARHDWNGYVMSNLHKFGVTQQLKKTWQNLL